MFFIFTEVANTLLAGASLACNAFLRLQPVLAVSPLVCQVRSGCCTKTNSGYARSPKDWVGWGNAALPEQESFVKIFVVQQALNYLNINTKFLYKPIERWHTELKIMLLTSSCTKGIINCLHIAGS